MNISTAQHFPKKPAPPLAFPATGWWLHPSSCLDQIFWGRSCHFWLCYFSQNYSKSVRKLCGLYVWNTFSLPIHRFCILNHIIKRKNTESSKKQNLNLPLTSIYFIAFISHGSDGKESSPWVRKIPWRRAWQPTPVFLPGDSPWGPQSMGVTKSWIQLSNKVQHVCIFLSIYIYLYCIRHVK